MNRSKLSEIFCAGKTHIAAVVFLLLGLFMTALLPSTALALPSGPSGSITITSGLKDGYAKGGGKLSFTITWNLSTKKYIFNDKTYDGGSPFVAIFAEEKAEATSGNYSRSVKFCDKDKKNCETKSVNYKVDADAPTTTISPDSTKWYNKSSIDVTLTATDTGGSGVDAIHYKDTHKHEDTVTFKVSEEHPKVSFYSEDEVGNEESTQDVTYKFDLKNPTISFKSFKTDPNANGWYNSAVTATWDCSDGKSGIDDTSCQDSIIDTEGTDLTTKGTAKDNAGNSAEATSDKVNIDLTDPELTYTLDPEKPNANGWYKGDIKVKWECSDKLSGIADGDCPAEETLSTEKSSLSVTRSVTDKAGNKTEVTIDPVNLDKTAPELSGKLDPKPNSNGWYKGNANVVWSCSDSLSGIADEVTAGVCPLADGTITGEGTGLTTSADIYDKAGNKTTKSSPTANIDRTSPSTSAKLPQADNGWYHTGVKIDFNANDSLSGIEATYYKFETDSDYILFTGAFNYSINGIHTLSYYSVDKAGNVESSSNVTVKIDESQPLIKAVFDKQNVNNWYNGPVKVTFICIDTISGITFCPEPVILNQSGVNQSVTGEAVNGAGIKNTIKVSGINIDLEAPIVKISELVNGFVYKTGAVPTPTATAEDGLSGIDKSTPFQTWYYGMTDNGVGWQNYHVTAHDNAGNPGSHEVSFKVEYFFGSFVEISGASGKKDANDINVYETGKPLTVKFQLKNADGSITQIKNPSLIKWLAPVKGNQLSGIPGEFSDGVACDSYGWEDGMLVYRWNTTADMAGYYWKIGIALDDGQIVTLVIGLE
jgi:hypothetical protein